MNKMRFFLCLLPKIKIMKKINIEFLVKKAFSLFLYNLKLCSHLNTVPIFEQNVLELSICHSDKLHAVKLIDVCFQTLQTA